jgi:triacylglycerol lipase
VNHRNPVLLIHGIDDTAILFERLQARLRDVRPFHALDLVPNDGKLGLEKLAEQIADYVEDRLDGSARFDIVSFSMGGLIARYYVQRLGAVERVERLITIRLLTGALGWRSC